MKSSAIINLYVTVPVMTGTGAFLTMKCLYTIVYLISIRVFRKNSQFQI